MNYSEGGGLRDVRGCKSSSTPTTKLKGSGTETVFTMLKGVGAHTKI